MQTDSFTAFQGDTILIQGSRDALVKALSPLGPHPDGVLIFSDETGRQLDLDLTGAQPPRGRPKLGVKAREVTLLPRHWEWLRRQRGGASATLRRLVEEAMRDEAPGPAPDAAYAFLSAIAGNLPGYETSLRLLYANDPAGFALSMQSWPDDIRTHALKLARLT
ncbi:MAG: DUF2239 family protein [Maritimibacter sp.]